MCAVSTTLEFFSSTSTMAGVQVWCFMLSFKPELLFVKLPEFGRLQRYSQKPDADDCGCFFFVTGKLHKSAFLVGISQKM